MTVVPWDPEWSTPVFSLQERDRRWKRVRDLMARDGLDAIVCLPETGRFNRGNANPLYLTQLGENQELVTVVFPLEGQVVAWLSRPGLWPTCNWGVDIRRADEGRGSGAGAVIKCLKEIRFERGAIAISGLTSSVLAHVRQAEGEANWQSVESLKAAFPNARVVSAEPALGEARYQKTEEEIDFIRKGVGVSEKMIQAAATHGRPGIPERTLFAHMQFAGAEAGGSFPQMFGWTSGPRGSVYHRLEQPTFRQFGSGDVLYIEIEGRWGGYVGRTDQSFSIGPAHRDHRDAMEVTYESFNRVFEALKPGVTVGDLLEAGQVTGMNGRARAGLRLQGCGTGDDGPNASGSGDESLLAVEIKEGCCLLLKPGCVVDGNQPYGNWGDSVVVKGTGAERLGTRPQKLYELCG